MNEKLAIDTLQELVVTIMQQGGFKDFDTLDLCRNSVAFLKSKYYPAPARPEAKTEAKAEKKK